jgi:hypothetical protein
MKPMRFTTPLRAALLAACSILVMAACTSKAPEPKESEEIVVTGSRGDTARARPDAEPSPTPSPVVAPPAPVGAMRDSSEAGAAATSDTAMSAPPPLPTSDGESKSMAQAGTLTAGDYDDVLNPGLYADYLEKTRDTWDLADKDLPFVDADARITVKITDRAGKPMPFAEVRLATPGGKEMFHLTTGAAGTVYLYPGFDAIEAGTRLRVGTSGGLPNATRALTKADIAASSTITLALPGEAPKIQKMDVLLTLDATGSMTDEMGYLQAELESIFRRIKSAHPGVDLRAGLIVYRDVGDEYVTRTFAFTGKFDDFRKHLAAQSAYDGGDMPEAMDAALTDGLKFDWREDAVKVNLLVADAPPHDEDISKTWDSALMSRVEGIHIVPVAASGVDPTAEFVMRAMAQATGGRYLFLTDDSGVGNAHAEPDVDCYVVTRLNGLVERVLTGLLTGTRAEPSDKEIIRTVGNYQGGICKPDRSQSAN